MSSAPSDSASARAHAPSAPVVVAVIVAMALAAIVAASIVLRAKPHTYSSGDQALLEIYTLHAVHGQLDVGAYSRFHWHHPGPALFYLFAPGYALSGDHKDSLFATTLVLNLAIATGLLWALWRFGGGLLACAGAGWLLVLFLRSGYSGGWDFGDLLGSAWNPHAPMLALGLLIVLAAALAAGHAAVLPWVVGLASFAVQAHVGLAPVCAAIVGAALLLRLPKSVPVVAAAKARARMPWWVAALDGLAGLYGVLLLWLLVVGGFDAHVGGVTVTVNSIRKVAMTLGAIVLVRHLFRREHPRIARALRALPVRRRRLTLSVPPRVSWSTAAVVVLFWALPAADELRHPLTGNVTQIVAFMTDVAPHNLAAGTAAFAYYLTGVLRPDLIVANGGNVITAADLHLPGLAGAVLEIGLLLAAMGWARRRGLTFHARLAAIGVTASLVAWWSMWRVRDDVFDHLAFWITIVGVINLTTLTAAAGALILARDPSRARARPVSTGVLVIAAVAVLAAQGVRHLAAGHQQDRMAPEVRDVEELADLTRAALRDRALDHQRVLVDLGQDAWGVAVGVVLELYKSRTPFSVAPAWTFLVGDALAPTGREAAELTFADPTRADVLSVDPAQTLLGKVGRVRVYLHLFSKADRVRMRSAP